MLPQLWKRLAGARVPIVAGDTITLSYKVGAILGQNVDATVSVLFYSQNTDGDYTAFTLGNSLNSFIPGPNNENLTLHRRKLHCGCPRRCDLCSGAIHIGLPIHRLGRRGAHCPRASRSQQHGPRSLQVSAWSSVWSVAGSLKVESHSQGGERLPSLEGRRLPFEAALRRHPGLHLRALLHLRRGNPAHHGFGRIRDSKRWTCDVYLLQTDEPALGRDNNGPETGQSRSFGMVQLRTRWSCAALKHDGVVWHSRLKSESMRNCFARFCKTKVRELRTASILKI